LTTTFTPTTSTQKFSTIPVPKTCARCGQNFTASGREYLCQPCKTQTPKADPVPRLSFREKQIVQLIKQAKSNKEIAYELRLTVGTVKEYIYHIFRKLGVTNRTELALWGRDYAGELA